MTLSVIIPCYDTEAYLPDCLQSVCALAMEDMEILFVIDGSPDNSADLVRQWQKRDGRIRMIEQENMGLCVARNNGLRAARGEFIYFLDSDDRLSDAVTLPHCCQQMREEQLDILRMPGNVFFDPPELEGQVLPNERAYFSLNEEYPEILPGPEMIAALRRNNDWCVAVPSMVFRRELLIANELFFIPGQIHEDEYYVFTAFFLAKRVRVTSTPIYDRRVRPDSIMTRPLSRKNVLGNLTNMIEVLRFMEAHRDIHELDSVIGLTVLTAKRKAAMLFNELDEDERQAYLAALRPDQFFYHRVFVNDEAHFRKKSADLEKQLREQKARSQALTAENRRLEKDRNTLLRIQNSRTYRLARILSWPIRALRRLLSRGA